LPRIIYNQSTLSKQERYASFSGISPDMDGQVKFVWRTEAVTAQN